MAPLRSYAWDFGDGNSATGVTANHTFQSAGTFSVTLTVTDDGGATDQASMEITVVESAGPFGGERIALPGRLEAEHYDLGGEGVAYHDSDVQNRNGRIP